MHLIKKIGINRLFLFIAFMGIIGLSSKILVDDGRGDSVGNEEDYRYIINQDGTAKIVGYLKEDQEVRIPEGVVKIGNGAFQYCQELERISISQSVEKIEGNLADNSGSLTEIEVDSHNAVYASVDGVLYNRAVTELLEMPEGKDLSGFQFPDSVTAIGDIAFYNCGDLKSIAVPKSVTQVENKAIGFCEDYEENVSYQIAVKRVGASSWKKYDGLVIKGLKSGKQYKVKVRPWREIEGERYYGKWSRVEKVTAW